MDRCTRKMETPTERGLVVIDSPVVGLVAILPIGMVQVSSVNLTVKPGATLTKGEELGYFLFSGTDIVMLFQNSRMHLDARISVTSTKEGM